MSEIRAELAIVSSHIGLPGEPSAVIVLARQVEGFRPPNVDRSYPVKWFCRLYLADAARFDGSESAESVITAMADRFHDQRFELAVRRAAIANLNGQDNLIPVMRPHRMSFLNVTITDSKETVNSPTITSIPKTALVSCLAHTVAKDRFRIVSRVEELMSISGSLNTLALKAPKRRAPALADEDEETPEDPISLALQYAVWLSEIRMPWYDDRLAMKAEIMDFDYNPLAQGGRDD